MTDLITLSEYTCLTEEEGTKDLLKQFNLEVQLHGGRKPSELIKWSATSLPSLTHSRLHSLHRPSVAPATVTCFCQSVIGTTLAPLPFPRTHRALHGEEGTDRAAWAYGKADVATRFRREGHALERLEAFDDSDQALCAHIFGAGTSLNFEPCCSLNHARTRLSNHCG